MLRISVLLTEITLLLPQLQRQLVKLCRPVEISNSQVALRLRTDVTNHVLSLEKDIKLNTINREASKEGGCGDRESN